MSEKKSKVGFWAAFGKIGGKIISFLLKALKFSKIGLAGASFAGYAALYSWKFAALLMIAVGFHESGHVWAMKRMGLKTKGFYFIPFIGGAAISEDKYKTYGENVYISIMGPIWGAALAYASGTLYLITGNPLWAASAAWMATINLFNLLPINPLDGGQLLRSISFSIGERTGLIFLTVSLVLCAVALVTLQMGLFALILFLGGAELFVEYRRRKRMKREQSIVNYVNKTLPGFDEILSKETFYEPAKMNKEQLTLACLSYGGTIVVLIVLLKMTNHIPGADLAHNFFE